MSLDRTSPSSKTKKIQVDLESWRSVEQFEDDRAFEEFEVENEFNQVRKLGLNFPYHKSGVAGCRSGQEIGTDLHLLLQVRGLRPTLRRDC